jgi:hypothetical protein
LGHRPADFEHRSCGRCQLWRCFGNLNSPPDSALPWRHRIDRTREDDYDGRGGGLCRDCRRGTSRNDYRYLAANKLSRQAANLHHDSSWRRRRSPNSCPEAALLDEGFTVGLVLEGFAKMQPVGPQKVFVVKITAAGRKAIAE